MNRTCVLVVEDEPLVRLGAVDLVEGLGLCALEAANADDALRTLEQRDDVAVVFTDIDMPGSTDGVGLSRIVRERWPQIELLIATGKAVPAAASLPHGVELFTKPYAHGRVGDWITGAVQRVTPRQNA